MAEQQRYYDIPLVPKVIDGAQKIVNGEPWGMEGAKTFVAKMPNDPTDIATWEGNLDIPSLTYNTRVKRDLPKSICNFLQGLGYNPKAQQVDKWTSQVILPYDLSRDAEAARLVAKGILFGLVTKREVALPSHEEGRKFVKNAIDAYPSENEGVSSNSDGMRVLAYLIMENLERSILGPSFEDKLVGGAQSLAQGIVEGVQGIVEAIKNGPSGVRRVPATPTKVIYNDGKRSKL